MQEVLPLERMEENRPKLLAPEVHSLIATKRG